MAIFYDHSPDETKAIYESSQKWKLECLLEDGSLLWPGEKIWTLDNLKQLKQAFVNRPDFSKNSFEEKLKIQLKGERDEVYKLVCEILFVYYLFPAKIHLKTKLKKLAEVASWANIAIDENLEIIQGLHNGIGKTGMSYNTRKPYEITYLCLLGIEIKELSPKDREELFADIEKTQKLLDKIRLEMKSEHNINVQIRHLLLHLLFPEKYERIASNEHRERIIHTFKDLLPDEQVNQDQALFLIREKLKEEYPGNRIDFYRSPVKERWNPPEESPPGETDESGEADDNEITMETWKELLVNKNIFYESDLEYLNKMLELGGEATATQLAISLNRHFSSFNAPVVHLAKRILKAAKMEPPKREDGKDYYWSVLFEGEVQEDHHFLWRLKPNLKEAMQTIGTTALQSYTKEDFLKEVFMDENQYETIVNLLKYKKNLIFQGPPGVGKTFVSKRLAYSLMGVIDPERVEIVQFHQNYSYDDFVMGYRPNEDGFSLEFGIFYDFCEKALKNPHQDYYFVIDEINRGNLSKIFGELFMLIEKDKRNEYVTMGYSKKKFTVPGNIYLIGTMNTADRSLAQLEVALRRRFAFVTLEPAFNEKWKESLQNSVSKKMVEQIELTIKKMNKEIVEDFQLGSGYAIGHSFFTSRPEDIDEKAWYKGIFTFEIIPLLEEYFFDRPEMIKKLIEAI